jgi:periplasmic protein TonB
MMSAGKLGLAFVVLIVLSAGSGLAAGRSQDQGNPPAAQADATPQSQVPQRIHVSIGVTSGLLVKKVQPKYPKKARTDGIQGTVVLHVLISEAGDIETAELVSGHPLLAPAAIKAVKQWKYKPYLLEGKPVKVETEIEVNFTLSN